MWLPNVKYLGIAEKCHRHLQITIMTVKQEILKGA